MKPNQHEFKVMGLEPYAKKDSKQLNILLKKFNKLDYPAKPRWPLDKKASFLKGAGVKL